MTEATKAKKMDIGPRREMVYGRITIAPDGALSYKPMEFAPDSYTAEMRRILGELKGAKLPLLEFSQEKNADGRLLLSDGDRYVMPGDPDYACALCHELNSRIIEGRRLFCTVI